MRILILATVVFGLLLVTPNADAGRRGRPCCPCGPSGCPCGPGGCPTCPGHPTLNSCPTCPKDAACPTCVDGKCEAPKDGVTKGGVLMADNRCASDALDEVNRLRAARGLQAFQRDESLTKAARACVEWRVGRRWHSHCPGNLGDFAFLPAIGSASAAGCEGYPGHTGWAACCTFERHRYAGAAWMRDASGQLYCQIYVR